MGKIFVDSIIEDYEYVVGFVKGRSAKNNNRPYIQLYTLKPINYGTESSGFSSNNIFFWSDKEDIIDRYKIEVGDQVSFLYVGSGDLKKLKSVDVVKPIKK